MFCQSCGAANDNNDQFCGQCGSMLKGSAPQAPAWGALPTSLSPQAATVYPPASAAEGWQAPTLAVPPPVRTSRPGDAPAGGQGWTPQPNYGAASLAPTGWRTPPPGAAAPAAASTRRAKRRRRWPWYFLLFLLIFGVVAAGGWILFLRPAVHQSVDGEIQQGLQRAVGQIPFDAARAAPSGYILPIPEDQMNTYLSQNSAALAPITSMQISLQPGVMVVTFQAYGFGSTVSLGLAVQDGKLIAQNVQVSGLLSWVETPQELTPRLNEALVQVTTNLGHQLGSVTIDEGVLKLTFA